jgi:hypothetical protein
MTQSRGSNWPTPPPGTYIGPDGRELTLDEWSELYGRRKDNMAPESWWRRETVIDDEVRVSTVWLGLNHRWGPGPPLYWETMIFGGDHDEDQWRYSSREAALDDHERITRALRAGQDPDE